MEQVSLTLEDIAALYLLDNKKSLLRSPSLYTKIRDINYDWSLYLTLYKKINTGFINDCYQTKLLCTIAVIVSDGLNIQYIPKKYKTYNLCFMSLSYANAIYYIPAEYRDYNLCLTFV